MHLAKPFSQVRSYILIEQSNTLLKQSVVLKLCLANYVIERGYTTVHNKYAVICVTFLYLCKEWLFRMIDTVIACI